MWGSYGLCKSQVARESRGSRNSPINRKGEGGEARRLRHPSMTV
jgi:hypothetical protein